MPPQRKERRVRAGYVPQEEVPVYVPRHVRERRAAAGETESTSYTRTSNSTNLNKNNSIPGYSASPPRGSGGGSRKPRGRGGIGPTTQASSKDNSSVEDAVNRMVNLNIKETPRATATISSTTSTAPWQKTEERSTQQTTTTRGRGTGSFKYQPTTARTMVTESSTRPLLQRPPIETKISLNNNDDDSDDDDGPPPGFTNKDPWNE